MAFLVNGWPFYFNKEENHVWEVLKAVENVLGNNHRGLNKGKEGEGIAENTFRKYQDIANTLLDNERKRKLFFFAIILHDIAKYSISNAVLYSICNTFWKKLTTKTIIITFAILSFN